MISSEKNKECRQVCLNNIEKVYRYVFDTVQTKTDIKKLTGYKMILNKNRSKL